MNRITIYMIALNLEVLGMKITMFLKCYSLYVNIWDHQTLNSLKVFFTPLIPKEVVIIITIIILLKKRGRRVSVLILYIRNNILFVQLPLTHQFFHTSIQYFKSFQLGTVQPAEKTVPLKGSVCRNGGLICEQLKFIAAKIFSHQLKKTWKHKTNIFRLTMVVERCSIVLHFIVETCENISAAQLLFCQTLFSIWCTHMREVSTSDVF